MKELLYTDILKKSWDSMKQQLALFAALSLVMGMGIWIASMIPVIGFIFVAPLTVGYFKCIDQLRRGNSIDFKDFFWGFMDLNRLLHAVIMNAIIGIGTFIGFLLLVVPGIWFLVSICFANVLFVLWKQDGVAVIQKSIKLVEKRWWNIAGFLGVIFILNGLGSFCFLIGLLVTTPLSAIAIMVACEELLSEIKSADTSSLKPSEI